MRATRTGRVPEWLVMQIRSHRATNLDYLKRRREALREHQTVEKWEERTGDLRGAAKSLNNIGIVYLGLKLWTKALEAHAKSREFKTLLGDSRGIAQTLHNVGKIHYLRRDYERAGEAFAGCLGLRLGPARDRHGVGQSLVALGWVAFRQNRLSEAENFARRALTAHMACRDETGIKEAKSLLRRIVLAEDVC